MAEEITIAQLAIERERGATVVDVREVHEYIEARVPGVHLVPLATIPDSLDALPRDETLYVICHSGVRSQYAADFLNANGFDAVSVAGGTMAWVQQGFDYDTGDDR
jgi:rhodanese-related sulfurtransferase